MAPIRERAERGTLTDAAAIDLAASSAIWAVLRCYSASAPSTTTSKHRLRAHVFLCLLALYVE